MTIKELKEILSQYDEDFEIEFNHCDYYYQDIVEDCNVQIAHSEGSTIISITVGY